MTENVNEIVIEWMKGQDIATVTAYANSRMKGKILKLADKYPDEVDFIENKDGSIVAHVPVSYVKLSNKKQNFTEEQRKECAERLKRIRDYKS